MGLLWLLQIQHFVSWKRSEGQWQNRSSALKTFLACPALGTCSIISAGKSIKVSSGSSLGAMAVAKTTLLSIIAGYKRFTSGQLTVFGRAYSAENILTLRKRIGWISSSFFDNYYHQEMVKDIVLAGLTGTLGTDFAITDAEVVKAKELITELGIGSKFEMPFDMLSKGERQHVLVGLGRL